MRDNETPALFTNGNEKDLETTPGYIKLAATCDELLLRLKFETSHETVDPPQNRSYVSQNGGTSRYPAF